MDSHGHERAALRAGSDGLETRRLRRHSAHVPSPVRQLDLADCDGQRPQVLPVPPVAGKPLFETRAFARFSVRYRNATLSAVGADAAIPAYWRQDVDVSPAECAELRGQLVTFDIVGPRLAVLFRVANRAVHGEPVGAKPGTDRAATAPFPACSTGTAGRSRRWCRSASSTRPSPRPRRPSSSSTASTAGCRVSTGVSPSGQAVQRALGGLRIGDVERGVHECVRANGRARRRVCRCRALLPAPESRGAPVTRVRRRADRWRPGAVPGVRHRRR